MKERTFKPVLYNSYKCDETVVRVNEYSTISAELVSQMVSVDFPTMYNCIVVDFSSRPDLLESLIKDFVEFADKCFSVVLIQRVGFSDALLSVFSPRNMHFIHSKLSEFKSSHFLNHDFSMEF